MPVIHKKSRNTTTVFRDGYVHIRSTTHIGKSHIPRFHPLLRLTRAAGCPTNRSCIKHDIDSSCLLCGQVQTACPGVLPVSPFPLTMLSVGDGLINRDLPGPGMHGATLWQYTHPYGSRRSDRTPFRNSPECGHPICLSAHWYSYTPSEPCRHWESVQRAP